jgi:hypothetical protein
MTLAHHPLVVALPLVVPAVLLSLMLVGIVLRDRRAEREGGPESLHGGDEA